MCIYLLIYIKDDILVQLYPQHTFVFIKQNNNNHIFHLTYR